MGGEGGDGSPSSVSQGLVAGGVCTHGDTDAGRITSVSGTQGSANVHDVGASIAVCLQTGVPIQSIQLRSCTPTVTQHVGSVGFRGTGLGKRKKEANASSSWTTRFKKQRLPDTTTGVVHGTVNETMNDVALPGAGMEPTATVDSATQTRSDSSAQAGVQELFCFGESVGYREHHPTCSSTAGLAPGPMLLDFQRGAVVSLSEDRIRYSSVPGQVGLLSGTHVAGEGVLGTGGAKTRKRQLQATEGASIVGKRRNIRPSSVSVTAGGANDSLSKDVHSFVRQTSFNIPVTNDRNETHGVAGVPLGPACGGTAYGASPPIIFYAGASTPALQAQEEEHAISQNDCVRSSGDGHEEMRRSDIGLGPRGSSRVCHPTLHSRRRGGTRFPSPSYPAGSSGPRRGGRTGARSGSTNRFRSQPFTDGVPIVSDPDMTGPSTSRVHEDVTRRSARAGRRPGARNG